MKSQDLAVILCGNTYYFLKRTSATEGKKKKTKPAIGKFQLIIPSPFPSFPKDTHSQALQCNYSSNCLGVPFLGQWEKLSTTAWHPLFLQYWFLPLLWSNRLLFLASPSPLWKGHCCSYLPYVGLYWLNTQLPVKYWYPPWAFPSPSPPALLFSFSRLVKLKKTLCTKEMSAPPRNTCTPTGTPALDGVLEIKYKPIQSWSQENTLEFLGLTFFFFFLF